MIQPAPNPGPCGPGYGITHLWRVSKARAFYRQQGWTCLDLHALMEDRPTDYGLPEDGIHLNQASHAFFAQAMFNCIQNLLPEKKVCRRTNGSIKWAGF